MRDWLVSKRSERGQSQQALADEIGIAQSSYSAIESGKRNPSVEMAKRIAKVIGCDWTRFFQEFA